MLRKTRGAGSPCRRRFSASMRPQRNAAENIRTHPALGAAEQASMRPQRNAAENTGHGIPRHAHDEASMRPQRNAAENLLGAHGSSKRLFSFNEAAA